MSSNNRILYSCQAVGISEVGRDSIMASGLRSERHGAPFEGTDAFDTTQGMAYNYGGMVHGVQSIGITTNFNLEQVFELGQIDIYENIEGIPDVEITLEKVLDGYPLIYLMATTGVTGQGGSKSGILNRSKQQCDLRLGIFAESVDNVADADDNSGKSEVEVYCSGVYVSSVSYSFPVDGNFTESITLVGNNKDWLTGSKVKMSNENAGTFDGNDEPHALVSASGGVQRREDVLLRISTLPESIRGVNGTGVGNGNSTGSGTGGTPLVHLQSFSCSTDLGREDVLELGRKNPYARTANFPVEVTCDIEAITAEGDFISALERGNKELDLTANSGENTPDETIKMVLRGGYVFDLGGKNRLSSVSYGGGDAGGGNASCTYSYSNFNVFEVRHHSDLLEGANDYKPDIDI